MCEYNFFQTVTKCFLSWEMNTISCYSLEKSSVWRLFCTFQLLITKIYILNIFYIKRYFFVCCIIYFLHFLSLGCNCFFAWFSLPPEWPQIETYPWFKRVIDSSKNFFRGRSRLGHIANPNTTDISSRQLLSLLLNRFCN